tara:strand:- start:100 stop:252 length:153 start_codon:yes stop_codon:yes gene_type:complete
MSTHKEYIENNSDQSLKRAGNVITNTISSIPTEGTASEGKTALLYMNILT